MVEIRITYETLFDLLRREKNREDLQPLEKDFYEQVLAYLKEKEALLNKKEDTSYFSNDIEKIKVQFQNIRRIVKELYERREKKIINIALVKARTGSDVIDTTCMLESEVVMFEDIVMVFSKYKRELLDSIINLREFKGFTKSPSSKMSVSHEEISTGSVEYEETQVIVKQSMVEKKPVIQNKSESENKNTKKIKIVDYLPKFMGRSGEVLGPFEKDATVELDAGIADLLLKKGRAQLA